MSWLSRLESFYLNILRVVILVLATVLLAAGVLAATYAVPTLLPSLGGTNARHLVSGDGLSDFRASQRGEQAAPAALSPEAGASGGANAIDDRIKASATLLVQIVNQTRNVPLAQASVERFLAAKQASLPDSLQGDYADNLLRLLQGLKSSPDPSINPDQLVEWHYNRFTGAAEEAARQDALQAAKHAMRVQSALVVGAAALVMFGLFLLLVFGFVLVKIERNLRLVAVQVANLPPTAS